MPKNHGSIDFDQFKEMITNQILDAIKDLTEEEKAKLVSRLERSIAESKDEIWRIHIGVDEKCLLTGYCGEEVNIILPNLINGTTYEIASSAFKNSKVESVVIPAGVTLIGRHAFSGCNRLKHVKFEEGFSGTIQSFAFAYCESLKEFSFPSGIICVDSATISRCQNLETVYIPNSVSELGAYAFAENVSLKNIHFDGTKAQWKAINKGYRWSDEMGDYTVYCEDGKIVTRKKVRKPTQPHKAPKPIVEAQISPEEETTEYIYCEVEVEGVSRNYSYITDDENICEGDRVVVPLGSGNIEVSGVVTNIIRCIGKDAPYPPSRTKKVLRKCIEE